MIAYVIPAEVARFDSNLDQSQAWFRLESGTHTQADIIWLKHETAERWYELRHNSGYTEAHNAAEAKSYSHTVYEFLTLELIRRIEQVGDFIRI